MRFLASIRNFHYTLRPTRYGVLPGLLVPLLALILLAIGAMTLFEDRIVSANQYKLVDERGRTRLEGVVDEFANRRESTEFIARAVADAQGVASSLEQRDTAGLTREIVILKAKLGIDAIRVFDNDAKELVSLGPAEEAGRPLPMGMFRGLFGVIRSDLVLNTDGPAIYTASPIKGAQGILGMVALKEILTNPAPPRGGRVTFSGGARLFQGWRLGADTAGGRETPGRSVQ